MINEKTEHQNEEVIMLLTNELMKSKDCITRPHPRRRGHSLGRTSSEVEIKKNFFLTRQLLEEKKRTFDEAESKDVRTASLVAEIGELRQQQLVFTEKLQAELRETALAVDDLRSAL